MSDKVVFSISTDLEMKGRELKALKPNKDGVYTGIPLTVLGMTSRNNVCYDKASVIDCLTNESSRFVSNLRSGDLEGEWGHPLLPTEPKECVNRLLYLDRKAISHHFTKIYAKEDPQSGYIIVYGDVKPSGPYGKYLKENFEDPTRNVSFSLRSATQIVKKEGGVTYKRMLAMFTFDAVDGPGYAEACKRFRDPACESFGITLSPSAENLDIAVDKQQFLNVQKALAVAGQESKIVDQRVLDAFGCDEIRVKERVLTKKGRGVYADASGKSVSLFDAAFGF